MHKSFIRKSLGIFFLNVHAKHYVGKKNAYIHTLHPMFPKYVPTCQTPNPKSRKCTGHRVIKKESTHRL